jgi:hypothetical protein
MLECIMNLYPDLSAYSRRLLHHSHVFMRCGYHDLRNQGNYLTRNQGLDSSRGAHQDPLCDGPIMAFRFGMFQEST